MPGNHASRTQTDIHIQSINQYDLLPNTTAFTMAPKPAVVTAGWHDAASHIAKTGIFQEGQLNPETAPRILADLVCRYTTIIGSGVEGKLEPVGSGTFVRKIDGQHGILTAGRVIGAIRSKEDIRVLPAQDRELVYWIRIENPDMAG